MLLQIRMHMKRSRLDLRARDPGGVLRLLCLVAMEESGGFPLPPLAALHHVKGSIMHVTTLMAFWTSTSSWKLA